MVFWIADDGDTSAAGNYYLAFRHILLGIVSAFGVDVWPQQAYKLGDIQRIKDCDRVNIAERRQNLRTFVAGNARTSFALQRPCACI